MMKLGKDLTAAKRHLENGELVAIPTETVYGLAANGLNAEAVARIYEAKKRPSFNPLILHVKDLEQARALSSGFNEMAQKLAETFWPGPLTLVVPRAPHVPTLVTAGLDSVALRIPRHPLTLKLLHQLDFPLAAPSANPSGYISATTPQHVQRQLGHAVSYILDGGPCTVGVESTIIKVDDNQCTLLRPGGTPTEEIEAITGPLLKPVANTNKPEAPGMLSSHYAPGKKVVLGDLQQLYALYYEKSPLVLAFQKGLPEVPANRQLVLSPAGDLREAAAHLFEFLHRLDEMEGDIIIAEPVPNTGLGLAINDRLQRAAADR